MTEEESIDERDALNDARAEKDHVHDGLPSPITIAEIIAYQKEDDLCKKILVESATLGK